MAVFICPNCSHSQDAPDEYIGRTAKCVKCETPGEITKSKLKPPPAAPPTTLKSQAKSTDAPTQPKEPRPRSAFSWTDTRIIIGLLAAILVAQLFGLTSTKTSATQWEYTIESPSDSMFEESLERLGNQGWELVFARRATSEVESASYEMIFKRPKR